MENLKARINNLQEMAELLARQTADLQRDIDRAMIAADEGTPREDLRIALNEAATARRRFESAAIALTACVGSVQDHINMMEPPADPGAEADVDATVPTAIKHIPSRPFLAAAAE